MILFDWILMIGIVTLLCVLLRKAKREWDALSARVERLQTQEVWLRDRLIKLETDVELDRAIL